MSAPDKRSDAAKEQDRNRARRIFNLKSSSIQKIKDVCGISYDFLTNEPIKIRVKKNGDLFSVISETHDLLWGIGLVFQEDYDFELVD